MPSLEMAGNILLFHILGLISAGMFYFIQSKTNIYVDHFVGKSGRRTFYVYLTVEFRQND